MHPHSNKIHITPDDQSEVDAYLNVQVASMFPQTDQTLYSKDSPSQKLHYDDTHGLSLPFPPQDQRQSFSLSTDRLNRDQDPLNDDERVITDPHQLPVAIQPTIPPSSPSTTDQVITDQGFETENVNAAPKNPSSDHKTDFQELANVNKQSTSVIIGLKSEDTPQLLIVPPEDHTGNDTTTKTSPSSHNGSSPQDLHINTHSANNSAQSSAANTPRSGQSDTSPPLTPRQQQLRDQQIAEEHLNRNRQLLQIERVIVRKQNIQEWGTYRIDRFGRVLNEPQIERSLAQPLGDHPENGPTIDHEVSSNNTQVTPSESSSHIPITTTSVNNLQAHHATDPKALQRKMEREKKWVDMIANWDKTREAVLKRRVRKGIPSSMRGVVWELILKLPVAKSKYPARYYYELLSQPVTESNEVQIRKDLPRLMQDNIMFRSPEAGSRTVMCSGQAMLYNILKAYSVHDPEVGYVQGMDSIAAPALLYFPEETTFWFLERLLQNPRYNLRDLYLPGFPLARKYVYIHQQLVKKHLPKLFECMKSQMVQHDMYAFRWYTMRYAQFAPELSYRVLDMYLYEGDKILYRIALALLQLHEKELIAKPDDMLENLKRIESSYELHKKDEGDFVINKALHINLTTADIQKLAVQYDKLVASGEDTLLMDF